MRRFWKGVRQDLMDAHQLQEALKAPKWEPRSYNEWLTIDEFRRHYLNDFEDKMPLYNGWVATNTASTTNTVLTYQNYPQSYGDAKWYVGTDPAVPLTVGPAKVVKDPKPETDMAWLKRRIAEVSWVPV